VRGHLRQRGDAFELRAFVGRDPVSGRKKYVTRTFRGRRRDAESELSKLVAEVSVGGHSATDTTFGDLLERWFAMAESELSPSTVRGYRRLISVHIRPGLGTVPLARLSTAQLDDLYRRLKDSGGKEGRPLSPASVRQVHAIIRRSLNQGVRWGWIRANPAANASPPRIRRQEIRPPDPDAVISLLEIADKKDPDLGTFLRLSATTGARRGELCGLRWADVDLESSSLTISRSIVEDERGVSVEKDTKTHAARRVALDEVTVTALRDHRRRCVERAELCGEKLTEGAYVFSRSPIGSSPLVPNDVTKAYATVRAKAGLEGVRLHDLRHFAATMMLAAGVPVRTVSGRLGHANAATTLGVYGHFLETSDKEAASTMGSLLTRRSPSGD
jgi:integrase